MLANNNNNLKTLCDYLESLESGELFELGKHFNYI